MIDLSRNPYKIVDHTMPENQLRRHEPYGLDLRHDLYDIYGKLVVPAWNSVVNVGQPDNVPVRRRGGAVDVVITRSGRMFAPAGTVAEVDSDELLVAMGEIVRACRCSKETNPGCQKFRGA
jgi:hypothetical protein